jgi:nicotinamide-nucleotide amidase
MSDVSVDVLTESAKALIDLCAENGLMIGTVESCTGGLVAGTLTEIPGSSSAVAGGMVTYSNELKMALAGVPESALAAHGAVSAPVALAMAEGGRQRMACDLCISITGVAGPSGGSPEKPVGLVHFARTAEGLEPIHREMRFGELGRQRIRLESVRVALEMLHEAASQIQATRSRP